MSTREVTAIALKILAIWMVFEVFLFTPAFLNVIFHLGEVTSRLTQVVIALSFWVVGLLMAYVIFRAASSALEATPSNASNCSISEGFLLQVAGAFFAVEAFEGLAGSGMAIYKSLTLDTRQLVFLSTSLLKLVVGLLMIVRREVFVSLLQRARGRSESL